MIDPSFAAVLRSRYAIRRFFLVYGVILICALIALWIAVTCLDANSTLHAVATGFFGNFAAADAIFLLTYGFYLFITPSGLRNAELIPLRNGEIADEIIDLRAGASDYWFWGRSGTYFRSVVLPKLDDLASKGRRHVVVRVVVPDPERPENACRYASMRRSLGENADERTLAANVLATVVATARAVAQNPYLQAQIGLCATVPVLRLDMSGSGGLVTRDARSLPAILVNAGNPYFEMFRDVVENELAQSRKVTWDDSSPVFHQEEASLEEMLSVINGLPSADQTVISNAKDLLASKAHRYAR